MSDQAEPSVLEPGLLGRIGQAVMRPLREVGARLLAVLWLIVAVGVIMASLVLVAGLSPPAVSAMRLLSEALPDPVILLGPGGHVLFCNTPARGLFASLREASHISSVIRTPEFLDAVAVAAIGLLS